MRFGLSRHRLIAAIAAVVVLAVLVGWMARPERHTVVVTGLQQPMEFVTEAQVLQDALQSEGVQVGAKDVVEPPLDTSLEGMERVEVAIRRAVPVTIVDGGRSYSVESAATTVGDLLAELDIQLGERDSLSVPGEAPVSAGMEVKVTRRSERLVVTEEEIPFETVSREDGSLLVGTTEVVQTGEAGLKQVQRRVQIEDGREVSSEVVGETIVKEPTPEIIAYGTMGVVSRGGQEFRYTQRLEMIATGYTAGPESNPDGNGLTYTGMRAERGVVAVDPNVVPLYTRLYVEGYGPAVAADTGGAIQGNRIDLCFDTVEEALAWGVRPVTVYVLGE